MSNKLKKNKTEKSRKAPVTLIGSINRKNPNIYFILAVKLLLTLFLTFGTIACFVSVYGIPYQMKMLVAQTLLFVTAFFLMFILIRKRWLIPSALLFGAVLYANLFTSVNSSLKLFWEYLCIKLDSRLLSTFWLVPDNSSAFYTNTQTFRSGVNIAMLVFTLVICFVFTASCCKRFYSLIILSFWALLFVPAFIAEMADYNHYFLIMIVCFFGLVAMSSSDEVFLRFNKAAARGERRVKAPVSLSALNRMKTALITHGHGGISGAITAAVAFIIIFFTQNSFSGYTYIDADDIIKYLADAAAHLGDLFSEWSMNGGIDYNGYFSSGSFFINNDIQLNPPPDGTAPVLNILSDSPDGIYLVGDIGTEFTGNGWKSISALTSEGSYFKKGYNGEVSDKFSPDTILSDYRDLLMSSNADFSYDTLIQSDKLFCNRVFPQESADMPVFVGLQMPYDYIAVLADDIFSLSSVKIEYLQNTNIIFKPYMQLSTSYRDNANINSYGDVVLRTANRYDWIESYNTAVMRPGDGFKIAALASLTVPQGLRAQVLGEQAENDYRMYEAYVYDTYMSVPENELANIRRLNSEFESYCRTVNSDRTISTDYIYAYTLSCYLKSRYTYSLTEPNDPQDGQTKLGRFLFDTESGHCAMYASAMTLALREHGIPARYITGFSTGTLKYDDNRQCYAKTISEGDLHAWVEVYIKNVGWIAFDPTGSSGTSHDIVIPGTATSSSSQTVPAPTQTSAPQTTTAAVTTPSSTTAQSGKPQTTPTQSQDTQTDPVGSGTGTVDGEGQGGVSAGLILIILISLSAAAMIAAAVMWLRHRLKMSENRLEKYRKGDAAQAVKEMHGFIIKLFEASTVVPGKNELPMDFALRADGMMNITGMKNNLYEAMSIIEKAEFSKGEVTEEERTTVLKYTEMLYRLVIGSAGRLKRIYLKLTL